LLRSGEAVAGEDAETQGSDAMMSPDDAQNG
jgi:hypothetical protein